MHWWQLPFFIPLLVGMSIVQYLLMPVLVFPLWFVFAVATGALGDWWEAVLEWLTDGPVQALWQDANDN